MINVTIETSRLTLRPFIEADAESAGYNSRQPIVAQYMSDMVLETTKAAQGWITGLQTRCNDYEPYIVLAIERKSDQKVIGLIGVAPKKEIGNEIEIIFSISDEYQNSGYATEAGKAIIWWAFEKAGQDMLSAIVKPENRTSRRVIEKFGFVHCDTRRLPYDGKDCDFDYFRLYHTDYLPGPEWDMKSLYRPEPMSAFFNIRADGYNEHMLSDGGEEDYKKFGSFIPNTTDALNILDVGCGTGIELNYIWKQAPNAHITCVDLSRRMLDLLLDNHPDNHDRITVIEASYLDWSYPADSFDLVVSSATMHHLWPEDKVDVYRKIKKSLKAGGCYIESDFIVDAVLAEQYRRRYDIITSNLSDMPKTGEYHIDIPSTLDMQIRLLTEAGFQVVEVLDEDIKPRGSGAILKARKEGNLMRYKVDKSYTFIDNPVEDTFQREAYFKLARKIFGLDFSVLYKSGYWSDRFIPYTLFDKERAVASVGVVIHDMKWQGQIKRYLQISTVMTDPEYRGRGLNRYLMEKVLDKWHDNCDSVYLYANDSVVDYYPKFGFEKATEYRYSKPVAYKECILRKLDLTSPADTELIVQKYAVSNPFSALTMENNVYLLMFHYLMFLRDNLYYVEKYDAVVIVKLNDEILFCYDIYTQSECQMSDILGAFATENIKTAILGFTPKLTDGCIIEPSQEDDTTFFVLKGKENILIDNKITFPYLSRA